MSSLTSPRPASSPPTNLYKYLPPSLQTSPFLSYCPYRTRKKPTSCPPSHNEHDANNIKHVIYFTPCHFLPSKTLIAHASLFLSKNFKTLFAFAPTPVYGTAATRLWTVHTPKTACNRSFIFYVTTPFLLQHQTCMLFFSSPDLVPYPSHL